MCESLRAHDGRPLTNGSTDHSGGRGLDAAVRRTPVHSDWCVPSGNHGGQLDILHILPHVPTGRYRPTAQFWTTLVSRVSTTRKITTANKLFEFGIFS